MKHDDAAAVVLVRAVEEVLPDAIPPEKLLDAHIAASDPSEGAEWLVRRAHYLIEHSLSPYTMILSRLQPAASAWVCIGLATAIGLAANYLGPGDKIHVIWNPLVILILWNILIYVVLSVSSAFARSRETIAPANSTYHPRGSSNFRGYRPSIGERLILRPVLSWIFGSKAGLHEAGQNTRRLHQVAQRFATLWWPLMRPVARLWFRRTMHLSSVGIAIGAIAGMYVRGLFFDYNVAWESTFVRQPETVAVILRYLLGPGAIVLGEPLPTEASVAPLFTSSGDEAAAWIHLYAVSAIFFIVIPRGFLTLLTSTRLTRARRNLHLDLQAGYYAEVLEKARNVRPKELEARVRSAVREECFEISDQFGRFVCAELYDARIVPRLIRFRETGGTLRRLEDDIRAECQSFGPELQSQMAKAGQALERGVAQRVKHLLGEHEKIDLRPETVFAQFNDSAMIVSHAGDRVGRDFASLVTTVVSGSVAIAVGTISGGFGETLGIALLVGLVESGPIGWIIGAIGGFVATVGALTVGRHRLRESLKDVPLPAAVVKAALWTRRFDRLIDAGRKKCDESMRNTLAVHMEQFSSTVADQVWKRLRALVGESQRPRAHPNESEA